MSVASPHSATTTVPEGSEGHLASSEIVSQQTSAVSSHWTALHSSTLVCASACSSPASRPSAGRCAIGWTLCHVQSDTALSDRMPFRAVTRTTATVNTPQLILDFPLLLESFVKELLRVQSNKASAQYVIEDTPIQGDDGGPLSLSRRTPSSWCRRPFITISPSRVRKLSN